MKNTLISKKNSLLVSSFSPCKIPVNSWLRFTKIRTARSGYQNGFWKNTRSVLGVTQVRVSSQDLNKVTTFNLVEFGGVRALITSAERDFAFLPRWLQHPNHQQGQVYTNHWLSLLCHKILMFWNRTQKSNWEQKCKVSKNWQEPFVCSFDICLTYMPPWQPQGMSWECCWDLCHGGEELDRNLVDTLSYCCSCPWTRLLCCVFPFSLLPFSRVLCSYFPCLLTTRPGKGFGNTSAANKSFLSLYSNLPMTWRFSLQQEAHL